MLRVTPQDLGTRQDCFFGAAQLKQNVGAIGQRQQESRTDF
jgi:hypothetical protein